jgi:hypothetical protein
MEWSLNGFEKKRDMNWKLYFLKNVLIPLLFIIGCKNDQHRGELQFFYYPNKNVYYNPVERYFLYSLDGSKSWSKLDNFNGSEPNTLGKKIVIYTSHSEVYKENNSHRKLYNGTLFAIRTKDSSRFNGNEVIEQKKVIPGKKVAIVKKDKIEKPKSGIGKFIKKLFGKKK